MKDLDSKLKSRIENNPLIILGSTALFFSISTFSVSKFFIFDKPVNDCSREIAAYQSETRNYQSIIKRLETENSLQKNEIVSLKLDKSTCTTQLDSIQNSLNFSKNSEEILANNSKLESAITKYKEDIKRLENENTNLKSTATESQEKKKIFEAATQVYKAPQRNSGYHYCENDIDKSQAFIDPETQASIGFSQWFESSNYGYGIINAPGRSQSANAIHINETITYKYMDKTYKMTVKSIDGNNGKYAVCIDELPNTQS